MLDRLDRYQTTFAAKYYGEDEEDARQKLLDKINQIADRLAAEEAGELEGGGAPANGQGTEAAEAAR